MDCAVRKQVVGVESVEMGVAEPAAAAAPWEVWAEGPDPTPERRPAVVMVQAAAAATNRAETAAREVMGVAAVAATSTAAPAALVVVTAVLGGRVAMGVTAWAAQFSCVPVLLPCNAARPLAATLPRRALEVLVTKETAQTAKGRAARFTSIQGRQISPERSPA